MQCLQTKVEDDLLFFATSQRHGESIIDPRDASLRQLQRQLNADSDLFRPGIPT